MTVTVPASGRLREVLALTIPAFSSRARDFWTHPRLPVLYPRYLVSLHTMIRASVPLMMAARQAVAGQGESDPLAGPLAAYFDQHIVEEAHHDDWLLDDLARIGVPRGDALEHMPSPQVAAAVGAQYYYIHHFHPVALLGYIALLEGYPPAEELAHAAAERTGYPIEAFRTLRKHAHLDPHHRDDLNRLLDTLPLTAGQMSLITINALTTLERLGRVLEEILAEDPLTVLCSERRS